MRDEGFAGEAIRIDRGLDMRYSTSRSYELNVPFAGDIVAAFLLIELAPAILDRTRSCEVVNIRARFTGRTPKPDLPRLRVRLVGKAAAIRSFKCSVIHLGRAD